jgi:hypothetical protein
LTARKTPSHVGPIRKSQGESRRTGEALGECAQGGSGTVRYDKIGRNDLCPCGRGKKYTRCHGAARGSPRRLGCCPDSHHSGRQGGSGHRLGSAGDGWMRVAPGTVAGGLESRPARPDGQPGSLGGRGGSAAIDPDGAGEHPVVAADGAEERGHLRAPHWLVSGAFGSMSGWFRCPWGNWSSGPKRCRDGSRSSSPPTIHRRWNSCRLAFRCG